MIAILIILKEKKKPVLNISCPNCAKISYGYKCDKFHPKIFQSGE